MASEMMIQVERTERSLVHSDWSNAPKPGCAFVAAPKIDGDVAAIGVESFPRAFAGDKKV